MIRTPLESRHLEVAPRTQALAVSGWVSKRSGRPAEITDEGRYYLERGDHLGRPL